MPETYKVFAECYNCGASGEIEIQFGKAVSDARCGNCGGVGTIGRRSSDKDYNKDYNKKLTIMV